LFFADQDGYAGDGKLGGEAEVSTQVISVTAMKISVITVTYNSAKTIADTMVSVGMQSYADIEHLVIDGASIDSTLKIVRSHMRPQTRLISESDDGIYAAMNKGLALASGEVVGFLNSDDLYADAYVLEKVANAFQDPAVEACYADLVYVSQDNRRVVRYWRSRSFIKGDFAKGWCPAHPTFYMRKSVIDRLGLFDRSYKLAADVEFMMRYLERGQIRSVYIPHVLVRMRVGGATNQSWKNIWKQNSEIFSGLRKNSVAFSTVKFLILKVFSRAQQYFLGIYLRKYLALRFLENS
jgi:glycosyltransferase involved in cell wall biosynthesis